MARTTRSAATATMKPATTKPATTKPATTKPATTRKSSGNVKSEISSPKIKQEEVSPRKAPRSSKRVAVTPNTTTRSPKRVKQENHVHFKDEEDTKATGLLSPSSTSSDVEDEQSSSPALRKDNQKSPSASTPDKKAQQSPKNLSDRKLQAYFKNANQSPFPDFHHPTADEAKLAHRILSDLHGERIRPDKVVASKDRAGCGDSPSVLDALVRTILSQNTSDKNSTRAKRNMDQVYGGSDEWAAIVAGGREKLQEAIKSGGLSVTKSKVIISILEQAYEKYGEYTLDHLHERSNEEAMREMLAFDGVGPKTASCVLLFCLQRESFAVDTHVHRITGLLGWRPKNASREETHSHLEVMIPDEDKYGLHILLVKHGKVCNECKAGGKSVGKCELRKAFRTGKIKGEAGDDLKKEEEEIVQAEKKNVRRSQNKKGYKEDSDEEEWFGV